MQGKSPLTEVGFRVTRRLEDGEAGTEIPRFAQDDDAFRSDLLSPPLAMMSDGGGIGRPLRARASPLCQGSSTGPFAWSKAGFGETQHGQSSVT